MNGLPVPCSFTRSIVFVQVLRSFNCWGQVSLHCTKWENLCQGHIGLIRLSWWFPWKTPLETLPQIFYPNASRNMGLCCLSWVFHCLDTRWPPAPFYERVEPDMEFCHNFVNSVTLFYKSFVLPCLLVYRDIFHCPKCNKAILEEDEISESAKGKVFAVTLAALGAFAMCWSHYEYCRCTGFLGLPELPGRCSKCNWQSWWWCPRGRLCLGIRRNGYIRWCESCLPCLFNDEHPCWWRTCMFSL